VGAGGVGIDVAHLLSHTEEDLEEWMAHWGVGDPALHPGGVTEKKPRTPAREVHLLQRTDAPIGKGLAKTSGWAHRAVLKDSGVHQHRGVGYDRVDDAGLHVTTADGESRLLAVDHVVVCAGQESQRGLYDELVAAGVRAHLVGGADVSAELDAKRAIRQGTELAASL
jgi:2,4-dienoyl-CoA reductase (NADPH2)